MQLTQHLKLRGAAQENIIGGRARPKVHHTPVTIAGVEVVEAVLEEEEEGVEAMEVGEAALEEGGGEMVETMEMEEGAEGAQGVVLAAVTGLGPHLAHLYHPHLPLIILVLRTTTAAHLDGIDTEARVG